MADSIFEKIIRHEIPAEILYEDEQVIAIKDINPAAPIHFLVIPKHKITDLTDINSKTVSLLGACLDTGRRLMAELQMADFRVVINTGEKAGQTVPHLHLHFLAGRSFTWPPG